MKPKSSAIAYYVNRIISVIVLLLIPTLPFLLIWYSTIRSLTKLEFWAILIAFYLCVIVTLVALWNLDKILKSVITGQVFTQDTVDRIYIVQRCCAGVSLICLPAAVAYLPLIFMVVIMAFLFLVIGVLGQVMQAAVNLREENDLTV